MARRFTSFTPKWPVSENAQPSISMPTFEYALNQPSRFNARIDPINEGSSLTSTTLSEIITSTQRAFSFACNELVNGTDSLLNNLKSLDQSVQNIAKLEFEAFVPGSFILPIRLADTEIKDSSGRVIRS